MANRLSVSLDILRSLVSYEPMTGNLFWLTKAAELCPSERDWKRWNSRFAGKQAFTGIEAGGYHAGRVMGVTLKAHRVAWALHYGEWPSSEIDHINCDKADNRISNLRLATHGENMRNFRRRSDNLSGFKGVHWHQGECKWQAQIVADGKKFYLGRFDTPELAGVAYDCAARELHGNFARPNWTAD